MPPKSTDNAGHGERGTASVELVAAVPFLLLALAVAAQIALAGQALWSASVAARAGARAALVGADAEAAARRALPASMRDGAEVEADDGSGVVSVKVPVPTLLPRLPEVKVGARSGLGEGDG
ncbi:MAG: pilus assembly protein [Actinobacteria bacterium]|nr:pilus assembly protein [Actinomycetota bacterium]